jgi:hypothetical protein
MDTLSRQVRLGFERLADRQHIEVLRRIGDATEALPSDNTVAARVHRMMRDRDKGRAVNMTCALWGFADDLEAELRGIVGGG